MALKKEHNELHQIATYLRNIAFKSEVSHVSTPSLYAVISPLFVYKSVWNMKWIRYGRYFNTVLLFS